jgi:hypothetical protein
MFASAKLAGDGIERRTKLNMLIDTRATLTVIKKELVGDHFWGEPISITMFDGPSTCHIHALVDHVWMFS